VYLASEPEANIIGLHAGTNFIIYSEDEQWEKTCTENAMGI
jgi:hypothetical protein